MNLANVTVTCFATSYAVALLLELTRPAFRFRGRMIAVAGFTIAGLVTHIAYLTLSARDQMAGRGIGLLASWYDWALLLALGIALCYAALLVRRPDSTLGYFLLPMVLAMIALAGVLQDSQPFSRDEAIGFWRTTHAITMLLVTVSVLLGFVAGIVFMIHSYRLKHKKLATSGLRLPSLEWLQSANRTCLVGSTILMTAGLFSGFAMHLNRSGEILWSDRGILLSCLLFAWLIAATLFEWFYKPARQGRKIAYLTLASFGFLVLAMFGVFTSGHGSAPDRSPVSASRPTGDDR